MLTPIAVVEKYRVPIVGERVHLNVVDHKRPAPPIVVAAIYFPEVHRRVVVELFEGTAQAGLRS